jgi:serine/threonine protein kinase
MANNLMKPPDRHRSGFDLVWNFHKYGLYWCGTRNEIMHANTLQKSIEFPITDINHGCIYLWESINVRKRFELKDIMQEGGCGTLTACIRHIEKWDASAKIWIAYDTRKCYLKKPLPPTKSFRQEAMLQIMAREVLERRGLLGAVPEVYDIFKLPSGEEVFTMEFKEDSIIVHNYVREHPEFIKSDRSLAIFFFQIAYYLYCLEEDLGLNHRDTKISNLLFFPGAKIKEYFWKGRVLRLNVENELILVDFGFACINELRAGKSYLNFDKCPKIGRDYFIFLCTIYTDVVISKLLSSRMRCWIEDRIRLKKINIFSLIQKLSDSQTLAMIYEFSEVFSEFPLCSTESVLDSLVELMDSMGVDSPLIGASTLMPLSSDSIPSFSLDDADASDNDDAVMSLEVGSDEPE